MGVKQLAAAENKGMKPITDEQLREEGLASSEDRGSDEE